MFFFFSFPDNDSQKYENVSEAILGIIKRLMDGVMNNVLYKRPFVPEKLHAEKPLYAALVPDEIFKGSHFERKFVTPFGKAWQELAVAVGRTYHGECDQEIKINGLVGKESLSRIQEVLNRLESREAKPNWKEELKYVQSGGGELMPVEVNCDILIRDKDSQKVYALELKGPLPNSDQTKVSKEKIFKLLCMKGKPVDAAFFALPYNPYGEKENYAWSFPKRWFNMTEDPCVLIGEETWDFIGGKGTYQFFVSEINKLGKYYKERIYREYLGVVPPEGYNKDTLR
jgi:hypothetical protein